jgi:hypothetical protein
LIARAPFEVLQVYMLVCSLMNLLGTFAAWLILVKRKARQPPAGSTQEDDLPEQHDLKLQSLIKHLVLHSSSRVRVPESSTPFFQSDPVVDCIKKEIKNQVRSTHQHPILPWVPLRPVIPVAAPTAFHIKRMIPSMPQATLLFKRERIDWSFVWAVLLNQ